MLYRSKIFTALVLSPMLSTTMAACSPSTQNCWIKVLIAQSVPPAQSGPYVSKIAKLAPDLEQLHIRITSPSIPSTSQLINLVTKLKSAYPNLLLGFHPDNSKNSYSNWGCSKGDWRCVFSNTIKYMNTVNAKLKTKNLPVFKTFSLEQSYIEPADLANVAREKACLSGKNSILGIKAEPAVTFGNVLPSCGGPNIYGSKGYDYGYPQFYNLYHNWTYVSPPPFPENTLPTNPAGDYTVVDANTECKTNFPHTVIPNQITQACKSGQGTTVYQKTDPQITANYVGWIIANKYKQIGNDPFPCYIPTNSGTAYITLSGEPDFLGAPQWNQASLLKFHNALTATLTKNGVNNADSLKFAIWNFSPMLH